MAELFKFRCYQCHKLIGAPASRFGSVVKCPKCGVELIVPSPDDEGSDGTEADPEALDLEGLGLRIDPEPISRPTTSHIPPMDPRGSDPVAFLHRLEQAEEAGDDPDRPELEESPEFSDPTEAGPEAPPDLPEPAVEPLVSRARGRATSRPAGPTTRSRDVVLPRTAAVAWALFALLGLAFAFLSGLLLGQRLGR